MKKLLIIMIGGLSVLGSEINLKASWFRKSESTSKNTTKAISDPQEPTNAQLTQEQERIANQNQQAEEQIANLNNSTTIATNKLSADALKKQPKPTSSWWWSSSNKQSSSSDPIDFSSSSGDSQSVDSEQTTGSSSSTNTFTTSTKSTQSNDSTESNKSAAQRIMERQQQRAANKPAFQQRGEKLNDLSNSSDKLKQESSDFAQKSTALKKKLQSQDKSWFNLGSKTKNPAQ